MTTETDTEKRYTLTIPRPQYDRLGGAFELDDTYFRAYDIANDTIKFSVTERQRLRFAKYAKKQENEKYWICQMFLPRNIVKYCEVQNDSNTHQQNKKIKAL